MSMTDHTLHFGDTGPYGSVKLGTGRSLGMCGDFTFECWARPGPGAPAILSRDGAPLNGTLQLSEGGPMLLVVGNELVAFGLSMFDDTRGYGGEIPVYRGVWHHFALRFNKAKGKIDVAVNGRFLYENKHHQQPVVNEETTITLGADGNFAFVGDITEVRIWGCVRTTAQILADMFRRLGGTEDGLAAYFPLDGREGDSGVRARNAKIDIDPSTLERLTKARPSAPITAATFVPSDLPLHRGPEANVVVAEFDGKHSCITIPDSSTLSFAELTIESWVRPTGTRKPTHMFPVVSKHSAGQGWELRAGSDTVGFLVTINNCYHEVRAPLPNGIWSHVAGVYSSGWLILHVNGREVALAMVPATSLTQSREALVIGGNGFWPKHKFQGEIAKVRVWRVARSSREIRQTMFAGLETGLVANYEMQCDARDGITGQDGTTEFVRWSLSDPPAPPSSPDVIAAAASDDPEVLVRENSNLSAENAELERIVAEQTSLGNTWKSKTATCGAQISAAIASIAAFKQEQRTYLPYQATLEERQRSAAALERELFELLAPSPSITVSKFAENLGIELARAQKALGAQSQENGARDESIALTNVSLGLRMFTTSEGKAGTVAVRFPTLEELAEMDPSNLSTFDVDIDAQAPPQEFTPAPLVPVVTNYTESAARRKLTSEGFAVKVAFQAADTTRADQVVTQLPTGGTSAPPGTEVTIFIGRPVSS
ncbi:MAG: PASTA domain-containing protein [Myxococcales bacterium]|nr:PASTA domain-containing protein [Myxococcales bacterium]